ncbi:hypothetical protein PHLGIDRAFT_114145 [Phlebiopsis gigantea 11061_1 CR5-6]|uniref:Transmembrane protein 242 n=1 Tax=Phlebiopsis gigantea (strain 11061_1 CR5-6) TaxID=745531 RepID=A0A0C3PVF2_PHLG1|nr:hypothetical protein PHLGIDRAFT_114145 [Phlebiopsis gigantea 11061_1 CR5-6]
MSAHRQEQRQQLTSHSRTEQTAKNAAFAGLGPGVTPLTTAALVVPVVLLKRHRATALSKAAPPPPRRTSTVGGVIPNTPAPARPVTTTPRVPQAALSVSSAQAADDFNGALYSAKAFGYATLMVLTGGAVTVWGVKTYMGVKDTQEFADRMRYIVRTKLPAFSSRLYRAPEEDDHTATLWNSPDTVGEAPAIALDPNAQWSWPDAERRLTTAFETGGFSGWARVALQELEAEGQAERRKRGHE